MCECVSVCSCVCLFASLYLFWVSQHFCGVCLSLSSESTSPPAAPDTGSRSLVWVWVFGQESKYALCGGDICPRVTPPFRLANYHAALPSVVHKVRSSFCPVSFTFISPFPIGMFRHKPEWESNFRNTFIDVRVLTCPWLTSLVFLCRWRRLAGARGFVRVEEGVGDP